jgi:hypothetical protein
MTQDSEDIVLDFFKSLGFPGIRRGEKDKNLCKYLKKNGYNFTPDLIAGPPDIKVQRLEGYFLSMLFNQSQERGTLLGFKVSICRVLAHLDMRTTKRKT